MKNIYSSYFIYKSPLWIFTSFMILFLLVFSAFQTHSSGQYATEIDKCIRNGVNVAPDSIISERNLTGSTCGFLMQSNKYIVVQPYKVKINKDSRIRLYLILYTKDSITNHKVFVFSFESLLSFVFVGAGRHIFAMVVLSKNNPRDVGEFQFVFRTRCYMDLIAEDFPIFTSPNYSPYNGDLIHTINNNLRDQISCSYRISSRLKRPFVVRFTFYHAGMIFHIDDGFMEVYSEYEFSGNKSVKISFVGFKVNKNLVGFSASVVTQHDMFSLNPHHHQGFMLHKNRVVCQNSFNMSNAKVYCRYLGYPGMRKLYEVSSIDMVGRETVNLQCDGSESIPADCEIALASSCTGTSIVGVVCQDLALGGGKDSNEGRVEIYYKGRKGLLCNHNFDMKSGTVICRQLGFRSAVMVPLAYEIYGSGNGLFLIDNLRCYGFEESIHECTSNSITNGCHRRNMAGLICSNKEPSVFSLFPSHHEGLLVYNNYFVCQNSFNINNAKVYCRYLGFPGMIKLYQNVSFDASRRQAVYLKCVGSETSPGECVATVATNCEGSSLMGVVCQDVMLAGGKDTNEGRVEIFYKERGYICYIRSQMESANVICKQLGFRFAVKISMNASYVNDLENRRFRSIDIRCLGNETSFHECDWSLSSCERDQISHLVCSGKDPNVFTLVPHHHQGYMVYNNMVVCQDSFNATNAMVYCRYLGYPGVRMLYPNSSFERNGRSTVNLQCSGSETSPADCLVMQSENCKESSTVEVLCQDVTLTGGNKSNEGRIEIYHKGRRGLLCRFLFDINAGHVICRQLGFSFADKVTLEAGNIYGHGHSLFLLRDLRCYGYESSIHECHSKDFGVQPYCLWYDVAGVVCSQEENKQKQKEMIQKLKSVLEDKRQKLHILERSIKDEIKRKTKLVKDIRKLEIDLIRNQAKVSSTERNN